MLFRPASFLLLPFSFSFLGALADTTLGRGVAAVQVPDATGRIRLLGREARRAECVHRSR